MKSRLLIFVIMLVFGAVAVGWVYESSLRSKIETAGLVVPDNIDYFLTDLNYRAMSDSGSLDFEFSSNRLEHYPRGDVSLIETPSLKIYRETDHWELNAQQGEFKHRQNLLRLQQQVVMQKLGANPIQLLTEGIRFEPDRDLVSSEASVLMLSKQFKIEAERAIFDLAEKVYHLTNTRAIYYHGDS
ncbi:MAG: LPS export ABC transporter periplasmic protein LptC [Gammaproteobacteria bacterium]|nr:LPS export ABC transporter periplasmic protein LptC [Gammaproteobacteria bacterium]MDH3537413.1 LPS export ABC transporter periplasmic protein LptC [Gammaproteobacteria bacterium]